MHKANGFTLIELLVVIAIVAIMATLAAPSMVRIIQSNRMSSTVNSFLADMRYARSEAIRRSGRVILCRSDAPEAANPSCNGGAGPGGNGWVSGWIVFHDADDDGVHDAGEPVLRVQPAITALDSIGDSVPSNKFRFTGTGRLRNLGSATTLQFGGAAFPNESQRVVCVSLGGRARIAGNGYAACGANNE